jgi:hypothetical protein
MNTTGMLKGQLLHCSLMSQTRPGERENSYNKMGLSPVIGCPDPMLSFNLSHLLHPSLASLFPLLHPAAFFSCPFLLNEKNAE